MKKMKRYENGGGVEFETKQGPNKSIDDNVRARAMASMNKETAEDNDPYGATKKAAPIAKATPKVDTSTSKAAPKVEPKPTPKAEPKAIPVAKTGEEKSNFEQKKAKALEGTTIKPTPKAESKPIPVARVNPEKSGFQEKMAKVTGLKAGGKVSSASKRADGIAIRGKTRA